MKPKSKTAADLSQGLCEYLSKYAYIPELKADGSAFEKRKIKSAVFNEENSQLVITGAEPDSLSYKLILKNQRKVYSRTDREYDKIIIRGFVIVGEDFSRDGQQKLIVYLKGYAGNAHVAKKIQRSLEKLIAAAKKETI
jgi:hypothetical protein